MNQSPDIFLGPKFATKQRALTEAGSSSIRVVSDFDRTMTKAFHQGLPSATSMSIFYRTDLLSDSYTEYNSKLHDIYRPIELDNSIDEKTKYKKMEEWWTLCLEAMLKENISVDLIKEITRISDLFWRPGTTELFSLTTQKQIPLIVFSAGIGNVIEEYLQQHQVLSDWVRIVSNFLKFDQAGKAVDYTRPVLHAANKHEAFFRGLNEFADHNGRHFTILLGDQLGDATVVQDLDQETVLKIGFLNQGVESDLRKYQDTYDAVITNDGSMDFVTRLIEQLT